MNHVADWSVIVPEFAPISRPEDLQKSPKNLYKIDFAAADLHGGGGGMRVCSESLLPQLTGAMISMAPGVAISISVPL